MSDLIPDSAVPSIEADPWYGFDPKNPAIKRDPPDHTRLRRLVSRAFSVPAINKMQAEIEATVGRLIDAIEKKSEMDVIADLALPLPSEIICKMMGVPLADREKFTVWTAQAT